MNYAGAGIVSNLTSEVNSVNPKIARNTVYGVPFLDQQKQAFVLTNHQDYDQISRMAGGRASTMKPYVNNNSATQY
jgi:hypothetical protein